MSREEKIAKIKEKIEQWLKTFDGKYNFISGIKAHIADIKKYDSSESGAFGSWIANLYRNKIEIVVPLIPAYSMWNTPIHIIEIGYSDLEDEDLDTLYKNLFKK